MDIETLGHAGLLIRDDADKPVLLSDPWILGSCYWRSWWLMNYPSSTLRTELSQTRYCYVTHEHPDHFHTASIRHLPKQIHYLVPDLPEEHMAHYLRANGHTASVVTAFQWVSLRQDVQILSIPIYNDDSVLLIDTPRAVIINLNDTKPQARQLRVLRAWLDSFAGGKRRVLLSSYSPASVVNSFIRHGARISLRQKSDYVRAVCRYCSILQATDFMPFASQVIFRRRDSQWANAFKVTFDDLQQAWTASDTRLLPPFSRLNLTTGKVSTITPDRYLSADLEAAAKVDVQERLDSSADISRDVLTALSRKLGGSKWLLALLFPRGIGFDLGHVQLHYNPWSGALITADVAKGDFTLQVPAQAFKDAVTYGHFGDMGTTMFTIISLNSDIDPRRVYIFFFIMSLNDYGHTTAISNAFRWLRRVLWVNVWRIPPPVHQENTRKPAIVSVNSEPRVEM